MAEQSTITSSDLAPVTDGATACDHLRELGATRTKFATFLDWIVNDSDGKLSADFKLAILNQLLKDDGVADPNTNGWFVRTNSSTGKMELVQRISLSDLPEPETDEEDEDEREIYWNGSEWAFRTSSEFFGAPTSGGTTVPTPDDGGVVVASHGLTGSPNSFACYLVCNSTDAGYAVGDKVNAVSLMQRGGGGEIRIGCSVGVNSSQIFAVFAKEGSATRKYFLINKASFDITDNTDSGEIDPAKWDVMLFAKV